MFFVATIFVLFLIPEMLNAQNCNQSFTVKVKPIEVGKEAFIGFPLNLTIRNNQMCRSTLMFNNNALQNFYLINNTFFLHFLKVKPTDFGNYTLLLYRPNGSCRQSNNFEVIPLQPTIWTDFLQFYIWPVVSGVVIVLVIVLVACLARRKTNNLERKIDELRDLTEEQAKKMRYTEKLGTFEETETDPNITATNGDERPHHIEIQSTPSYPPPSPPVNARQKKMSPSNRKRSDHFYDQCQPVKDRPPFPPPASAGASENPMYDDVAPDENMSGPFKFVRSVKSLVKGNSRKFGQQFARKYGNISAINIPAFRVVSPSAQHANTLPNYDEVEIEAEPPMSSSHY